MTDKRRVPLLIDEPPILVYPSLAAAIGINKAIIMQQVHFLLNSAKVSNNQYNLIDAKWWVYNSYNEWLEYFPWLSNGGLKRMFQELEKDGFIISRQSVKNKSDRRKWYTIDYQRWDQFVSTIGSKCADEPSAQNAPMVGTKSADGYSETPSDDENKDSALARERINSSRQRETDPYFEAIAAVWNTRAGGFVGGIKSMLTGKATGRSQYAKGNFDDPVTDVAEIVAFGNWAKGEMRRKGMDEMPTYGPTVQRWFYSFRAEEKRKAERPANGHIPVNERRSARDYVRVVNQ